MAIQTPRRDREELRELLYGLNPRARNLDSSLDQVERINILKEQKNAVILTHYCTLAAVEHSLIKGQYEIDVPEPVRARAKASLDRMFELGA